MHSTPDCRHEERDLMLGVEKRGGCGLGFVGLGIMVWGSGLMAWGSGFSLQSFWFMIEESGFRG